MTPTCPHYQTQRSAKNGIVCKLHGAVSLRMCAELCVDWPDKAAQTEFRRQYREKFAGVNVTVPTVRPGDVLHTIIQSLGFSQSLGCGCASMQRQMNEWGWLGCWQHRDEIVAWLVKKAAERGITVERESILGLLKEAFRVARNKPAHWAPEEG